MTFSETVAYLYSRLPMFYRIGEKAYKADLTNTVALCEHLGNPQHTFKSVHIAGTNGKGSSSHMLAAIMQSAGYKTGLYTSPHLKSFTERIRLNGQEIPQDFVTAFMEKNKDFTESLEPSFFELTVGMAFDFFAQNEVDVALIETGLGGRLDSTNVIVPEVSLITNISFDHQNLLGNTLGEIAGEKAGIIKPNVPVVISEYQAEIATVFKEKAEKESATIYFASETFTVEFDRFENGKKLLKVKSTDLAQSDFLQNLETELLGEYQLKNIAGVLQTIIVLQKQGWQITENHIRQGISQTTKLTGLKGRWQILAEKPLTICDVAHNEGGIREVVNQLKHLNFEKLFWVFGTVNDKDLSKILPLLPKSAYYFFCEPNLPRAMKANVLGEKAKQYDLQGEVIENVNEALQKARQLARPNDIILIAGSNFIVAELEEL